MRAVVNIDVGVAAALHQSLPRGTAFLVVEDGFFVCVALSVRGFLLQLQRAEVGIGARMIMIREGKSGNGGVHRKIELPAAVALSGPQMGLAQAGAARPIQGVIERFAGIWKAGWLGRCSLLRRRGLLSWVNRRGLSVRRRIHGLLPWAGDRRQQQQSQRDTPKKRTLAHRCTNSLAAARWRSATSR